MECHIHLMFYAWGEYSARCTPHLLFMSMQLIYSPGSAFDLYGCHVTNVITIQCFSSPTTVICISGHSPLDTLLVLLPRWFISIAPITPYPCMNPIAILKGQSCCCYSSRRLVNVRILFLFLSPLSLLRKKQAGRASILVWCTISSPFRICTSLLLATATVRVSTYRMWECSQTHAWLSARTELNWFRSATSLRFTVWWQLWCW